MPSSRASRDVGRAAVRFSIVGVANTAVGAAVIAGAALLGASPMVANVVGYAIGLLVSYVLNSRYTFGHRGGGRSHLPRYMVAFLVAFAANLTAVAAAVALGLPAALASVAGVPVYVVLFFLLCQFWVFGKRPDDARPVR